jgi:hypothetical protein
MPLDSCWYLYKYLPNGGVQRTAQEVLRILTCRISIGFTTEYCLETFTTFPFVGQNVFTVFVYEQRMIHFMLFIVIDV